MCNYLIPPLAILSLLSACSHPVTSRSRPTDDSPARIAQDAAYLPHLKFAKATTQPIAMRYQDDWGNGMIPPGEPKLYEYRALFCAIWEDGLILWRQDPLDVRSPLLYGRLEPATIKGIKQRLAEINQQARSLKMRSSVVLDGGCSTTVLSFPGRVPISLEVFREDYASSENPEAYKALLDVWSRIKTTLDSARPPTSQPVSPGDVQWIERDGRQGVYKP